MSYFIPFFQEEEIIDSNLFGRDSQEVIFQNKRLVRCLTFAKNHIRKAINICQTDIASGIFCVLTESDASFTIWRQDSSMNPETSEKEEVHDEAMAELHHQLNESQLSDSQEEAIQLPIAGFELIYESSSSVTDEHDLAAAFQALEATADPIETVFQVETSQHQPVFSSFSENPAEFELKLLDSDLYSTPRSAFLALVNQELSQHIGSKADYLINKLLAEQPDIQPQKMLEAIAAEISDSEQSQNIQETLDRLTHEVNLMGALKRVDDLLPRFVT
ncbi:MAG: hypothetical protein QNJ46_04100 [Leptolyngbyaceae cyanobacterium MO_188.B28]|nr:hypothetical protein [Leptolyngbyaceae cyanobacterium MO_188.B28]